jgi:RecA/RadA recombinase
MSKLMARMKKLSTIEGTDSLADSKFFKRTPIATAIPALNVALSGEMDGGMTGGIVMLAGESKSYKTGFLIQLVLAFQKKHPDGVCIFYDCEFSPMDYWENAGINMDLILHTPVVTVEQMKHDMAKHLDAITEDENVMFAIDSIGGLASKKEAVDAVERSDMPVDMTRAKALNSFFRIITPQVNKLGIDVVLINSFYETMDMYPKRVYAGGKKVFLACNDVWFIRRVAIKDGKIILGYMFTLVADKSRTIKEASTFPIDITWDDGIEKYSCMYEWAKEFGALQIAGAWVKVMDLDTGELSGNVRAKAIGAEFYDKLMKHEAFKVFLRKKYVLNYKED